MLGLNFWYRGHFNRDCIPSSTLWFGLSSISIFDKQECKGKGETGKEKGKTGRETGLEPERKRERKQENANFISPIEYHHGIDKDYHSGKITHDQYIAELFQHGYENKTTNIVLNLKETITVSDIYKTSLIIYLFANVQDPNSNDSKNRQDIKRIVERRIDELIIPLGELLIQDRIAPFVCLSKSGKFTFCLFPNTTFIKTSQFRQSLTEISQNMKDDVKSTVRQWLKNYHDALNRLDNTSLEYNAEFYKQGPDYKWLSKYVRFCNMSFIQLPCTTSRCHVTGEIELINTKENVLIMKGKIPPKTTLPGWAFLVANGPSKVVQYPSIDFYNHQLTLALERNGLKTRQLDIQTLLEIMVEIITWPVRMAIYMRDLFDECCPLDEDEEINDERDDKKTDKRDDKKTDKTRQKTHRFKLSDQFANLWTGLFPEKSSDDCESFAIATYILFQGLKYALKNSQLLHPVFIQMKPLISQYEFIMTAVTISSEASEKSKIAFQMESEHDDEKVSKKGQEFDPKSERDPNIICHEIGILVPITRLLNWSGVEQQDAVPGGFILPNLIVDATEYAFANQSDQYSNVELEKNLKNEKDIILTRLYARVTDWTQIKKAFTTWSSENNVQFTIREDLVFKNFPHVIISIYDTSGNVEKEIETKTEMKREMKREIKIIKFLQLLNTFKYEFVFITKLPRSLSRNWASYHHIVDGICDSSDIPFKHFVFMDSKTERRAVPFANVMDSVFEKPNFKCILIGPTITREMIQDLDLILQDEPSVKFPPF